MVASFRTVHEYTKDLVVLRKLQVFISVAKIVELFLRKYQADKPMLPFLATDLFKVLCDLLYRFVKGFVLSSSLFICHQPQQVITQKHRH